MTMLQPQLPRPGMQADMSVSSTQGGQRQLEPLTKGLIRGYWKLAQGTLWLMQYSHSRHPAKGKQSHHDAVNNGYKNHRNG